MKAQCSGGILRAEILCQGCMAMKTHDSVDILMLLGLTRDALRARNLQSPGGRILESCADHSVAPNYERGEGRRLDTLHHSFSISNLAARFKKNMMTIGTQWYQTQMCPSRICYRSASTFTRPLGLGGRRMLCVTNPTTRLKIMYRVQDLAHRSLVNTQFKLNTCSAHNQSSPKELTQSRVQVRDSTHKLCTTMGVENLRH
mmetsp:Transcript_59324/g.95955  ORF Transcript_59324/g.95955 Transcript_59324/m.95955 type:complete len:201 (+) Transcript_59324:63-665(+)